MPKSKTFIQWKGTDVCMDIHCECGALLHADTEFFYYFKCPKCSNVFKVGTEVSLTKLHGDEKERVEKEYICHLADTEDDHGDGDGTFYGTTIKNN